VVNPAPAIGREGERQAPGRPQCATVSGMDEIYVSTDVETDGPVAGRHSLLSIGSAAYTAGKQWCWTRGRAPGTGAPAVRYSVGHG
jgi:hypothetical protein